MYSFKTFDCLCCGKVYPLKYIYVSAEIPAICDDCIFKIKDAYEAYLNDDALDELECLLKSFNTPTETKVTLKSMKAIYEGKASPLLGEDELSLDEEIIEFNNDAIAEAIVNNDIKTSKIRSAHVSHPSTSINTSATIHCSSLDYQLIAQEAAKLMEARKNRPIDTAITMAWKTYALQKLKELYPTESNIFIEVPDYAAMSIVVDNILSKRSLE